jgi:hypothetical protein
MFSYKLVYFEYKVTPLYLAIEQANVFKDDSLVKLFLENGADYLVEVKPNSHHSYYACNVKKKIFNNKKEEEQIKVFENKYQKELEKGQVARENYHQEHNKNTSCILF